MQIMMNLQKVLSIFVHKIKRSCRNKWKWGNAIYAKFAQKQLSLNKDILKNMSRYCNVKSKWLLNILNI